MDRLSQKQNPQILWLNLWNFVTTAAEMQMA